MPTSAIASIAAGLISARRLGAAGEDVDPFAGEVTEPAGCHLRPARVVHAEEHHARPVADHLALDLGQRPQAVAGEPLDEDRHEADDLGAREQLVEAVVDVALDRLGAEDTLELLLRGGPRLCGSGASARC